MTVVIFIIVLAVLIFVHELGHFILAKMNGIRVDAFAIGFGPKLIDWKVGETRYSLNLIPFGGYVKIFGETPGEDSVSGPYRYRSFINKNKLQQIIVLAAGVAFNFIFAWLLYIGVFAHGVTATTEGFEKYKDGFSNPRIMVTEVLPDSPAQKAGLEVGDVVITAVLPDSLPKDLAAASFPARKLEDIQNTINGTFGKPIDIVYNRNSQIQVAQAVPAEGLVEDKYAIGIAMQPVADLKLPFATAIYEGGHYALVMIKDTVAGLYTFALTIFSGTANFSEVAGPVGIAGIVGNAANLGFVYLLMVTALISINLGVINLIPFPALDGGRILFVIIEAIIRRPIPHRFANAVNAVGFALLMLLMVVVTYKDILKLMS